MSGKTKAGNENKAELSIFERAGISERLALFTVISFAAHITLLLIIFIVNSISNMDIEEPRPIEVSFVEVTPVSVPAKPMPVQQKKPEVKPAEQKQDVLKPAEEVEEQEVVAAPAPVVDEPEVETAKAEESELSEVPEAEHDTPVSEIHVAENIPENTGELTLETDEDLITAAPEEAGEPHVAEKDISDSISGDEVDTDEGEAVAEERDGKVDVPLMQTFVGDRIQGQLEFQGKGREMVSMPKAPDFQLTRNTQVAISFKIDKNGRTYDIVVPPLGQADLEQKLRNFVKDMRFSAVLYSEADSATLRITLNVR